MPPRFHVAGPLAQSMVGDTLELPESVAHHAVRVVRLVAGDALVLFDGLGGEYAARIASVHKRGVQVRVERFDPVERESPLKVTLVQAIVANDAMDYAVRKSVELGVATIAPVITARSAPFPADTRGEKRHAHWEQIVIAACEQCGRNRVPAVLPVCKLAEWQPEGIPAFVCAPGGEAPLLARPHPGTECAVLVGPEGGFAPEEIARLVRNGAARVALGPRVLRTETAAVAALALVQALWGDLR